MRRPVTGDAIASRCVFVMRGKSTPFVVLFTSRSEDAFGELVPMPALPVEGKVFCALEMKEKIITHAIAVKMVSIKPRGVNVEFVLIEFFILVFFVGAKVSACTCSVQHTIG